MSEITLEFIIANFAASAAILIVLALRKPIREAFGARFGFGNDWTISTPDGSAFEWRVGDVSLGPLGPRGPVKALDINAAAPGAELRAATIQRNNLSFRYGPNHPEVQQAEALVRDLTQRWEAQIAPARN